MIPHRVSLAVREMKCGARTRCLDSAVWGRVHTLSHRRILPGTVGSRLPVERCCCDPPNQVRTQREYRMVPFLNLARQCKSASRAESESPCVTALVLPLWVPLGCCCSRRAHSNIILIRRNKSLKTPGAHANMDLHELVGFSWGLSII